MIVRVDALEADQLIAGGTPTLDALPASVFEQEHLPGARSLPLETFEPEQVEWFDRTAGVLVYCFDQHCDLSARMAHRLADVGFDPVYDLIGGRAAWTALGLPTEGVIGDRRRISRHVIAVASIPITGTIADLVALGPQDYPVPVVNAEGVVLGAVYPTATTLPPDTRLRDVMVPAPGTIRPELRVDDVAAQLAKDGLDHVFVTTVSGVLVGLVITEQLHV